MGAVRKVWAICSARPNDTRQQIIAYCVSVGINRNTASTQYSAWKRAHTDVADIRTPVRKGAELLHEEAMRAEWKRLQLEWPALNVWTLYVCTRSTSRLGVCKYRGKRIGMSAWHVDAGPLDKVIDTLRHEAAHALAPVGARHGPLWKQWCIKVGAKPQRCATAEEAAHAPARLKPRPWRLICQQCGDIGGKTREPRWSMLARLYGNQYGARCRKCKSLVKAVLAQ